MHPHIQYLTGARVADMRSPAGGPIRWRREGSLNAMRWLAGTRRHGRLLFRLAVTPAVTLPLAAAGLAAATLVAAPAQAAATTATFSYTGGEQAYAVPAGTAAVTVTAVGAMGGIGGGFAGVGAPGAVVTATVPVPAGTTTLYVEVGGMGGTPY